MSLDQAQKLRALVANWSDKNLQDARNFVQSHKDLVASKKLTNAQLHGFLNVVRNVKSADDIKAFIQNQALKAERAGRSKEKMLEFWLALQSRCEIIRAEATRIAGHVDPAWAKQTERVGETYQQLLQKYVQHVIAEKLVLEKSKQ